MNLGSNDISAYSIDAASGKLKQVKGSPFGAGSAPYGIAIDPTGNYAYVPNSGSNNVSGYAIDATSGALKKVKGSPFDAGTEPVAVAADPAGKFVYVVNNGSNNVSAYAIGANNGALTPVNGSPFSAGLRPDSVAVDPTGKFAYISNLGSNNVSGYSIGATSGALTPIKRSPFRTGTDPCSVTVNPTGRFAYVPSALSDNIYGYAIGSGSGALTPLAASPFADPGSSEPLEVVIAPSGRFAYVPNGFAVDGFPYNVSAYTIDSTRGTLTPVQGSPFVDPGSVPYSGAVDSTSRFVYFTNLNSNNVSAYTIAASGALRKVKGAPIKAGTTPLAISVCSVTAGKCIPPPIVSGAVRKSKPSIIACLQRSIRMKNNLTRPYAINVCAVAAMLAGCGGLMQPVAQRSPGSARTGFRITSPSYPIPQRVGPNSSGTEVLTGKAKLIKPCHRTSGKHSREQSWSTGFSAGGKAKGPFPGTFTAGGFWSGGCNIIHQCSSLFDETFTITSGSSTISGTMQTFDLYGLLFTCRVVQNLTVPYTSGSVSGNALINVIQKKDFSEALDGL